MPDVAKKPAEKELEGGQDPLLDTTPQEGEFQDPLLKGKSPAEIEELFKMSKQVVEGQKTKLDKATRDLAAARATPPPPSKPDEPAKDFFSDPDGAMQRLTDAMERQVTGLKTDIADARREFASVGVQDRMRAKFPDWDDVKPYVDGILAEQTFPNPDDEGLLGTLYYTAKGIMLEKGVIKPGVKKEDEPVPGDTHRGAIPQHRSSPPPAPPRTPTPGADEVAWNDLDETERAMCKYYKMTPTNFRAWQNAEIEDVAESEIGLKKEKEA